MNIFHSSVCQKRRWLKLIKINVEEDRGKQILSYFNHILFQYVNTNINFCVAGGAVRDLFSIGYVTSDIDVYFNNRREALLVERELRKKKAKVTFRNKQLTNLKFKGKKIQLIRSVYYNNNIEGLIDNFDFTVCCGAVDRNSITLHNDFLMDLAAKRLVFHKINFPLSSMVRVHKYIRKGFRICNGNMLKLVKAIQTVDVSNVQQNVLEFYPDGKVKFNSLD